MSLRRSTFLNACLGLLLMLGQARNAQAQACCAGSGAVTPGRLGLHEEALVGVQLKAGDVLGSYDSGGHYWASSDSSELDLEQDLFAAARFLRRGQVSVLVPFIETRRTSGSVTDFGGGIGDVNLNARYDFTLAGASRFVPGLAALVGVTAPTGVPPDAANLGPLSAGATGIGAWQGTLGVATEQSFGPWLVGASAYVAQRTARTVSAVHERLAPHWTFLAAVAYVWPSEISLALSASYQAEGDATIDGADSPQTAQRQPTVTLGAVLPVTDTLRFQGSLFDNPPVSGLGQNQTSDVGALLTGVFSWL
jgi:hypothetical protein